MPVASDSNAIENSAIIGVAPEFVYTDGLAVEEVTVKFELENSVINNTLGTYTDESDEFKGIKRLNVFMFFEDVNMLLPVETFHDEATNTVYTKTDRVGTYCLVDMELWLNLLEITPKETPIFENEENGIAVYSQNVKETAVSGNSPRRYKDKFDVVFLIDWRIDFNSNTLSDKNFILLKKSILEMCDTIFKASPNARIRFVRLLPVEDMENRYEIIDFGNGSFFTNYSSVDTAISKIIQSKKYNYNTCNVKPALEKIVIDASRETHCIYILKKENSKFSSKSEALITNHGEINKTQIPIHVHVVSDYIKNSTSDENRFTFMPNLSKNTGGTMACYDDMYTKCLTKIYGSVPEFENSYKAIIATGYRTITLKSSLQDIYDLYQRSKEEEIPYNKDNDTDEDELCDYKEIMFENSDGKSLIDDTNKNNVKLFTFGKINDIMEEKLFYVEKGLYRYCNAVGDYTESVDSLNSTYILPIYSDPTNEDSDNDGLLDGKRQSVLITDTATNEKKEKIIAPKDPHPLKIDGPDRIWRKHIEIEKKGDVATDYNENRHLSSGNEWWQKACTKVGAVVLNFSADDKNMAYHSHVSQWQSAWGYNNVYDFAFIAGTRNNVRKEKFPFTPDLKCNDNFTVFDNYQENNYEFILWIWRGDYLNLGAGAEMGVYYRKAGSGGILDHYKASENLTLPMTLNLFNYNSSISIERIFAWSPTEPQWWITGFNPEYRGNVDVTKQVMIGSIDFNGREELYEGFATEYITNYNSAFEKYVILDDEKN